MENPIYYFIYYIYFYMPPAGVTPRKPLNFLNFFLTFRDCGHNLGGRCNKDNGFLPPCIYQTKFIFEYMQGEKYFYLAYSSPKVSVFLQLLLAATLRDCSHALGSALISVSYRLLRAPPSYASSYPYSRDNVHKRQERSLTNFDLVRLFRLSPGWFACRFSFALHLMPGIPPHPLTAIATSYV